MFSHKEVNGETRRALAVDIGGSKVLCGVVDEGGNVLRAQGEPLDKAKGLDGLMDAIRRCAETALDGQRVDVVGATIPGLADARRGLWVYAPFSGLSDIPIAQMLADVFRVPVAIENDVNACALADARRRDAGRRNQSAEPTFGASLGGVRWERRRTIAMWRGWP